MKEADEKKGPVEGVVTLRSAGGVAAGGEGATLRVAVMRSSFGTWELPKGRIEPGETMQEAAAREIGEEIGLRQLRSLGHLGWTEHEFERDGVRYRKRVDWFLFAAPADASLAPDAGDGILDCGWFPPEAALVMLDHANQRRILRLAVAQLRGRRGRPPAGRPGR
jgi:8-oxo-dGTP pyrophosphatase MutT (NUDIX family)